MRWLKDFLSERSLVELGAGVALGYGALRFSETISDMALRGIWPQSTGLDASSNPYTATIGRHEIYYGGVLGEFLALALVLVLLWSVIRALGLRSWRDDDVRECSHCLSKILAAARVCEFCTRDVEPAT